MTDPGVGIHNLRDAPFDANLKRKRNSKKDGERTSNPPHSLAKKPKKSETSKRIQRSADIEYSEV